MLKNLKTVVAAVLAVAVSDVCLADGYSDMVMNLNPIGYWRLDESGGDDWAIDEGGVSNGEFINSPNLDKSGAIPGNSSVEFDGSDDWVRIPHDDVYLLDEGAVSLWIKLDMELDDEIDEDKRRKGFFSKDSQNYDTGGHLTLMVYDWHVEARIQSASASYTLVSPNIGTSWAHILVLFGPGGVELYVNGNLEDWESYTGGLGATSGGAGNYEPIVIGANSWTSGDLSATPVEDYFEGWIDEVVLLDFRPNATQITNLTSTDGGTPEGIRVVEWKSVPPISSN